MKNTAAAAVSALICGFLLSLVTYCLIFTLYSFWLDHIIHATLIIGHATAIFARHTGLVPKEDFFTAVIGDYPLSLLAFVVVIKTAQFIGELYSLEYLKDFSKAAGPAFAVFVPLASSAISNLLTEE